MKLDARLPDAAMDLTLAELFTLIGRLDDTPGFDTPRERFRRFLLERVTDVGVARRLIEQCLRAPGQQSHRALQDLVVLLGRFVGFEVTFGAYEAEPPVPAAGGEWSSRRRMRLIVAVLTDQTPPIDATELSTLLPFRHPDADPDPERPQSILGIITPLFPGARLRGVTTSHAQPPLCALSLRGILHLGDLLAANRLTHEGVLAILARSRQLDSIVDLLHEMAAGNVPAGASASFESALAVGNGGSEIKRYWMCRVRPGQGVAAEPFVSSVIGQRHIVPVEYSAETRCQARPGDAVCFEVDGTGTVGEAEISEVLNDGSGLVRNPKRFSQVLRLTKVFMYSSPAAAAVPRPTGVDAYVGGERGTAIFLVTPQQFRDLTNPGGGRRARGEAMLSNIAETA